MVHNHSHNDTPWFVYECTIELDTNVRRVALFLLYLFIFIAGLLENLLVLWMNWRRWRSANGVLFCVLNFSLSDMMVIVVLPFFMLQTMVDHVWLWGAFLCVATNLVYLVNFYSSSFFLALMTLERYLSLTKPTFPALFPVVGRRRWLLCGGVWVFSLFLALLESVHFELVEWDEPWCYMWPIDDGMGWFFAKDYLNLIFQFLGPAAVIITCNVLIARAARATPDVQDPRDVWLVHVYSLVFVLCWLPYHLILVVFHIDFEFDILSCNTVIALDFLHYVTKVLTLFHCVANPILYNFLNKSFRNNLLKTVTSYIIREGSFVQTGTGPNGGGGTISNASTSQSDMDS